MGISGWAATHPSTNQTKRCWMLSGDEAVCVPFKDTHLLDYIIRMFKLKIWGRVKVGNRDRKGVADSVRVVTF